MTQFPDRDSSLQVDERAARHARQSKDPGERAAARNFAIEAARLLFDDKCSDVVVLDLSGRSQITDFFVIASGTSERQMRSAGKHVEELGAGMEMQAYRHNLWETEPTWVVLDFVDVVVHVFEPETRRHYDLEMLWGDAEQVLWRREERQ